MALTPHKEWEVRQSIRDWANLENTNTAVEAICRSVV
jgi:hypothetical protein